MAAWGTKGQAPSYYRGAGEEPEGGAEEPGGALGAGEEGRLWEEGEDLLHVFGHAAAFRYSTVLDIIYNIIY